MINMSVMRGYRLDAVELQAELDTHRQAVDTEYFDLSIREIVRMVEEEEIRVAPAYQRKFRWPNEVQSALIESLLLGLPIPAIFVATNKDGTWDVVDGLQRTATILKFYGIDVPGAEELQFSAEPLKLSNLNQLKKFSGLSYKDLPMPIRLTLGKRYVRVQVLSDKSDPGVRFELFRRLNAGAVALTPQEIRSCVFRGPFNSLIEELAATQDYKDLLKLQPKNKVDGTAEEIVLKFFAYMDGMDKFDGDVVGFLNNYIKRRVDDTNLDEDRQIFLKAVSHLKQVTGGHFTRSGVSVTPVNQLEGVLIGIARIFKEGKRPKIPADGWANDEQLVGFSTQGTNSRPKLRGRILRSQELFS
ncbi:hypothetical protein AQI95_11545 [Streptomyces yokosukanensis]|uniref:GmrSD restriction endonucleases N-terminal domain-containing protein n=1 Tax=Streptomyces yokosukanensis TaxID=67386 RepID=A0A101P934_9ACTN|nr:hypothetical protein AQI95_11545 [Streptomyces yokosukanensis]